MSADASDADRAYRPIADYGVIGDMGAAALVAADGAIDWCCLPAFDSPALFDRLLDADQGGFFAVSPSAPFESERTYLDRTNILQTRFTTDHGELRVTDFMPVDANLDEGGEPAVRDATRCIIRRIEGVAGEVPVEVTVRPTVGWGRERPEFSREDWGIRIEHGDRSVALVGDLDFEPYAPETWTARPVVREDETVWVSIQYLPEQRDEPVVTDVASGARALEATAAYWRRWLEGLDYEGAYPDLVRRSALALKLLVYAPSGGVVAAPTTSLPEQLGGVRNWDYRFVWLRDAGMVLRSLQHLGFHSEAMDFWEWLENICLECGDWGQIVYTIDGDPHLPERQLYHLDGYEESKPVRVGNGAAEQTQLDRFGYILEAAYICKTEMREPHPALDPVLADMADQACRQWRDPDHGVWEIGADRRQYTHSKVGCWVALDRALRLVERDLLDGDTTRWRKNRRELRVVIERFGYNRDLGAFTQTLDGDSLDASALMIPLVGFLPTSDPRVESTVETIREQLSPAAGLLKRYRTDDGLPGDDGAFLMCSFWLVSVLAEAGRLEEARSVFETAISYANDLGLMSEELDPSSGRLLGNFPQGFSHLGLIEALQRLERASSI